MINDYFSNEDSQFAAYQAELELQEWFESDDFVKWFNTIAVEEIVVPTEVFKEMFGE